MRTLQTELVNKGLAKEKEQKTVKKRRKPKQRKTEFSRRELEELMGTRKPRYSRSRGSIRQH